ncbi:MAG: ferritin-like domain-containing protein [Chloroflexi bacterium]|nr:ferritin-like domain-containing protein [Chloroflexota bacterium]MBU1750256.1 ferritin-like domain-containing protein [Chloroflexota bacterium]
MSPVDVVELLNQDLHLEWNAILIYQAHVAAISDEALNRGLAGILAVEERHAAELAQRIRDLGGEPQSMDQFTTASGRAIAATSRFARAAQMLQLDLDEEERATAAYRAHIATINDEETVAMLRRHLRDEEAHARWLAEQIAARR